MRKPFHTWTDLFRQLGWRLRRRRAAPGYGRPRTLTLEHLGPRQLLTGSVPLTDAFLHPADLVARFDVAAGHPVSGLENAENALSTLASQQASDDRSARQNPANRLDADADETVTARDALVVANTLTVAGPGPVAATGVVFYVDTNGDWQLSVDDFDAIRDELNAGGSVVPASPGTAPVTAATADTVALGHVGVAADHVGGGTVVKRDLPVSGLGLGRAVESSGVGVAVDHIDGGPALKRE